jgi:hypothetical protein
MTGPNYYYDELTDSEIWNWPAVPSPPTHIIIAKMHLVAEVSAYILPEVRHVQRRIERLQRRLKQVFPDRAGSDA